ncbi:unnamed protein product [Cylicocyclus nassatus]|uniref:AP3A hydrolase n=1 Tax=Cylicocyclus nassatus TaxID=53992 RepID=A0AA36H1X3_CYLNA|nr:unnamed protein product [Cylicocyclus nassatus]
MILVIGSLISLVLPLVIGWSPHPKLLLISFDGFRYDLLNATMCPNIFKWAARSSWFVNGVRSQYITYTAPNHMSIVTGLREQYHGIVSNYFWDTATGKFFDYFNSTRQQGVVNASLDPSWYLGEPIWLTNEKANSTRHSASFYWPNGEAPFPSAPHKPLIHKAWAGVGNVSVWMNDVDKIIEVFSNDATPVNFVSWYIAEPDNTLHGNGFYNGELRKVVKELDKAFGYLIAKLHDSGLEDSINVILTADHGHAEIQGAKNVMCVRDYIVDEGYDLGDHMIYPHNDSIAQQIYQNLTKAVRDHGYKVNVHLKENIPKQWYYSNSSRIGRIVIEPEVGWAASLNCKTEKLLKTYAPGNVKFNSSTHGMDPDRKEMRAFLIIGGPSVLSGQRFEEIPENIDLYGFMCHLLDIDPAPSNSSLEILSKVLRTTKQISLSVPGMTFESSAFFVLIIPSACAVMMFMVYACRRTIMSENSDWTWSQKGYRPLIMNTVDAEQTNPSSVPTPGKVTSHREDTSEDEF